MAPATNRPATTGTGTATSNTITRAPAKKNYPDHALLSGVTKDQLKSMPAFDYNK